MARMNFNGASDLLSTLDKVSGSVRGASGKALYHGAGIVAEEIRSEITRMKEPTDKDNRHGIRRERKQGLLDGLGIAEIERKNGKATEKVGFEGYNTIKYPKHPNGEPNVVVARSIENGRNKDSNGWPSPKHPFVRPAARRARKAAEAKMAEVIEAEIKKNL